LKLTGMRVDDVSDVFVSFSCGFCLAQCLFLFGDHALEGARSTTAFRIGEVLSGVDFREYTRAARWFERCFRWNPKTELPATYRAAELYETKTVDYDRAAQLYYLTARSTADPELQQTADLPAILPQGSMPNRFQMSRYLIPSTSRSRRMTVSASSRSGPISSSCSTGRLPPARGPHETRQAEDRVGAAVHARPQSD
jgi:hypothetical protein